MGRVLTCGPEGGGQAVAMNLSLVSWGIRQVRWPGVVAVGAAAAVASCGVTGGGPGRSSAAAAGLRPGPLPAPVTPQDARAAAAHTAATPGKRHRIPQQPRNAVMPTVFPPPSGPRGTPWLILG